MVQVTDNQMEKQLELSVPCRGSGSYLCRREKEPFSHWAVFESSPSRSPSGAQYVILCKNEKLLNSNQKFMTVGLIYVNVSRTVEANGTFLGVL